MTFEERQKEEQNFNIAMFFLALFSLIYILVISWFVFFIEFTKLNILLFLITLVIISSASFAAIMYYISISMEKTGPNTYTIKPKKSIDSSKK